MQRSREGLQCALSIGLNPKLPMYLITPKVTLHLSIPCHFDSTSLLTPPQVPEHSLAEISVLHSQAAGALTVLSKACQNQCTGSHGLTGTLQ